MQTLFCRIVLISFLSFLSQFVFAASDECKDILTDGTRALSLYSSRYEYRRLLESRLLSMTYQEAKSDTSITGSIPIGDIILGVGFDEKTFNSYKNHLQTETISKIDISKSTDILLSTGDPEIVKAWSTCMKDKTGLVMYFSDVHASSAVLNLEWHPSAGVPKVRVKKDFRLPNDVSVISGKDILSGKEWIVAGTKHQVEFKFKDVRTTLPLTLNVEKEGGGLAGAYSAYVPTRLEPFLQVRPYQFANGQCDKSGVMDVTAYHHTGTSVAKTFCSDSANGWRFSKTALQVLASVAIPGQIPGTFANHQDLWSGDFQVTVVLGCSNSTGTDIQCHATASAQEERWQWKPSEEFRSFNEYPAFF